MPQKTQFIFVIYAGDEIRLLVPSHNATFDWLLEDSEVQALLQLSRTYIHEYIINIHEHIC